MKGAAACKEPANRSRSFVSIETQCTNLSLGYCTPMVYSQSVGEYGVGGGVHLGQEWTGEGKER